MRVEENISIKKLNTFNVDYKVNSLITLQSDIDFSLEQIKEYIEGRECLILGGGSNILFTKDFNGNVLLVKNRGIEIVKESNKYLEVRVASGENLDSFVQWSVDKRLSCLHNLALIPGSVGATPVQNVGAYGVEIKDILVELEYLNLKDGKIYILKNSECEFGYRDSIFKHSLKDISLIKNITVRLPKYNGSIDEKYLQYSGIRENLVEKEITPKGIYDCIVKIRKEKLPSIEEYGSCGSTFKNPEISTKVYESLLKQFPDLPKYDTEEKNIVKIPAAYILEKLGWKNKRKGDVGTWIYHPLIVTNYGNANGSQILSFIKDIQSDFKYNTGIQLETEINIF